MTNILQAVRVIVNSKIPDVASFYRSQNRINAVGDALEAFVKDIFANTVSETDTSSKYEAYSKLFSYSGNANNPPDLMIKGGDAVEVKKVGLGTGKIALNSSYPSAKLFIDSPMITSTCRNCESWTEKDIIYAIGCFANNKLEILWLIYGDCYAASRETYEKIKNKITQGVSEISSVEFSVTKELGRVNKIDPLGITDLRIRGMWQIENPRNVYNYLDIDYKLNKSFRLFVLIQETKYLSFPIEDRKQIECLNNPDLIIKNIKIKSPDNPVKLISAKLINYQI
ncbi:MAG: NgoPII family restriction endonuclease [Tatlockia sp.]|nr:NgoPII family restriction endonuclease [Tatlockia sp.]